MESTSEERILIGQFTGAYRWLSNFWLSPVEYEGALYPSVEHAYQAAKSNAIETRERFQSIMLKPGEAKRMGRRVNIRADWEQVKLSVMLDLLRQKFKEPVLAAQLRATGEQELVEGNHWGDVFWGKCNGRGDNHLGRLLMQVRSEL